MSFKLGESVGPYRILDQLGQGGMATVFKAYHANLDRYVAIKVLHPAFKEDPNFEKRFQREAKVVANLEHPNIVPVYDYDEHEGSPYLIMRFIEGETLKARLAQGPMAPEVAVETIDRVADGLAYAHEKGVLHRDIKPSNIMLTNEGQVFLADFGLARIAQAGESSLTQDMMLGTPAYISPEQAQGEPHLDERTDIYSLGVILYEMVVGRVPFSADTPYAVIHDHIYTPLPTPRSVNPSVPEAVERVLLKALAKEPDDRYATASDLSGAFRKSVTEAGPETFDSMAHTIPLAPTPVEVDVSTAHPQETEPIGGEKPKRRWFLWALGGVGGLAVLCLAFLALGAAVGLFDEEPVDSIAEEFGEEPIDEFLEEGEPPPEEIFFDEVPEGPPPPNGECVEHGIAFMPLEPAEERVAQFPDNACAHLELAFAKLDAGLDEHAIEEVQQAIEIGLSGETLMFLGDISFDEGDMFAAAHMYGLAYSERGVPEGEVLAFFTVGELLDTPESEELIRQLTERFPRRAFPRSARAVEHASQGQLDLAEQSAVEGIVTEPESPVAHFTMGLIFLESDRFPAARVQFECVLRSLETPPMLREEVEFIVDDMGPIEIDGPPPILDGDPPVELLGCGPERPRR